MAFIERHIGPRKTDIQHMLDTIGIDSITELMDLTIPDDILLDKELQLDKPMSEHEYLSYITEMFDKNKVFKSYIGQGYYDTYTPSVILRNVLENPGWYTQYTPYQAEISQGRLEALLNFQTMIIDLTGLKIANASLLDEATAAAEAMAMAEAIHNKKRKNNPAKKFFVDQYVFSQTIEVINTRAVPKGWEVEVGDWRTIELDDTYFGVLVQFPNAIGTTEDYREFVEKSKALKIPVSVAADLLSLCLMEAPGEWGADIVLGTTQRMGLPMGYGGPHAAYLSTSEKYKRLMPGRIIGVSMDAQGDSALRMALQTREQHIRREKASSNICTAQALLAIMAGFYGVYHGPEGLKKIAQRIYNLTSILISNLEKLNYEIIQGDFFDTVTIRTNRLVKDAIKQLSVDNEMNFFYNDEMISISLDEKTTIEDLTKILSVFENAIQKNIDRDLTTVSHTIPEILVRKTAFMEHDVFHRYRSETSMMRYIKHLENKDFSLMHGMIPLGSCTMKLNASTEMFALTKPEVANIHPFVPNNQAEGYKQLIEEISDYLNEITGFTACSLQPNSGAQGEFTGLMVIRAYHESRGDNNRNITLIPSSAHGTNPASAVMAGMEVIVVECDENGSIDVADLKSKAIENRDRLASLMITYPSTHGVFETAIKEICDIIHENGGMVYMDGANMNAQVGYTNPGTIGADVCHLNLHKTFAIPHGGGGPGVGPICTNDTLAPFLPGHIYSDCGAEQAISAVSSAAYGSVSVNVISHSYIKMMGASGLKHITEMAILNANYIKARLENDYKILYVGDNGMCAHEMIVDTRPYKDAGISVDDIAKRLIDYGFHAPTMSFPVPGTLMIEPTESEDLQELDRLCDALLSIKHEILEVVEAKVDADNNVLTNAPHSIAVATKDEWDYPYSREKALFPLEYLKTRNKFWATVGRVDNAYGDRHLVCSCLPVEEYRK